MSESQTASSPSLTSSGEIASPTQQEPGRGNQNPSPNPPLEGDALKNAIKKQCEYYFSQENLAKDRFLISQMNPEMFVPIIIIAGFKMLRNLTQDVNLITQTMRESRLLIVNEEGTMVKPNVGAQRSTLIINVPTSTPVEEVKALFVGDNLPEPKEIVSDGGDCWSVTFENEEATINALKALQEPEKTFNGHPIHPQVKADAFYYGYAPVMMDPSYYQGMPYFYPPMGNPENPDGGWGQGYNNNWDGQYRRGNRRGGNRSDGTQRYERRQTGEQGAASPDKDSRNADRSDTRSSNYERGNRGGRGRANNSAPREGQPRDNASNANRDARDSRDPNRKRRGSASGKQAALVPGDFPPLPSQPSGSATAYTSDFKSYSKQEFADIIKSVQPEKPAGLEHPVVVRENPAVGLETSAPFVDTTPKKMTAAELAKRAPSQGSQKNSAKSSPKGNSNPTSPPPATTTTPAVPAATTNTTTATTTKG